LIFSVPHAVRRAAAAANALVTRRTLNGRLMRAEIIIGIPMAGPRASKLAPVLLALVILGGCSHTKVVGSSRLVHVALNEYRMDPARIRVSEGALTIYVRNFGRLTHNLVISQTGATTASTTPLFPGNSTELGVDLAPGRYLLASTILSDRTLGIYGSLEVTR
jgi:hypothetical protein